MKKLTTIISDIACGFSAAAMFYILISFINVNACNLNGGEIAAWNFFQLFF